MEDEKKLSLRIKQWKSTFDREIEDFNPWKIEIHPFNFLTTWSYFIHLIQFEETRQFYLIFTWCQ